MIFSNTVAMISIYHIQPSDLVIVDVAVKVSGILKLGGNVGFVHRHIRDLGLLYA